VQILTLSPSEIPIPRELTIATVTQTTNFIYTYDDTLLTADQNPAIARANALAASCETDLTTMQAWFSVSGGFGLSNQVTVLITNSIAGLGWNGGYQTGGKTQIKILPFTGAASADAAARAVFVAEMSEVLMSFATSKPAAQPGSRTTAWVRPTIQAGRTTGSFRIQTSVLSLPTLTRTATIMAGAVTKNMRNLLWSAG
jgi:hypothetical protein